MDKYVQKKLSKILILLIIFIILLPNFSIFFKNVYGVAAGTVINIPTGFEQYGAQLETADKSWVSGTGQEAVNKIWNSQGKTVDNYNWAYVTVGGQKRYLVALAQTYGLSGDYVDIYLKDGRVYPCVIGDSKALHEVVPDNTTEGAFYYNGVMYGHCYDNRCSVVEIMIKNTEKQPPVDFLNSMKNVTKIVNGGSCLNGDDPQGLDADYVTVGVTVGSQEEWLQALDNITNEMLLDGGWIYSNSKNVTDYTVAKTKTPRRTNCALMVTHALQYFGAFESNMKFWGKDDGTIAYTNTASRERLEEIAQITDYENEDLRTTEADLEPGDIVTYYGQHTNVYLGVDESGTKMWYDAGRGQTDSGDGGTFLKFTRTDNDIGMRISHIIRLNYNTTIQEQNKSKESGYYDAEADTYAGALGSLFREAWATICNLFEKDGESSTVLYNFKNVDNNNSSYQVGRGNGDILLACQEVTKMLLERGCTYSLNLGSQLIVGDIDRQLNSGKYFCCATYVTAVLYYAGVLTESQINPYAYHWTGGGGIPDMLKAAGWTQIPVSQAQPGDVINDYTVHAMIYAGDGRVWDQSSAVTSSSGTPPTGTTRSRSIAGCQVWRAPLR